MCWKRISFIHRLRTGKGRGGWSPPKRKFGAGSPPPPPPRFGPENIGKPFGLVQLPDTFANTLVVVIKDVLRHYNLPLAMCRGQPYDGTANMQGLRNGVATQIQAEVPSAIPVHCLAHCLQLVLQEAGRKCRSLNTERSYITRLRCSTCQSQIPTDDQCSHLIGKINQVQF